MKTYIILRNTHTSAFLIGTILLCTIISSCRPNDEEVNLPTSEKGVSGCTNVLAENYDPDANINDDSCAPTDCAKCNFFISGNVFGFDGEEKGVQPGDIICLDAAVQYEKPISLSNINGTADNPVIITNCGGQAIVDLPGASYAIYVGSSMHFRISGTGSNSHAYGIKLSNTKSIGISISDLSTKFEVDHLEVHDIGFAGIMAKTDPYCDPATQRDHFIMEDVKLHDNYVHDTDGEGMYIGNSFYADGKNFDECGTVYPHDIKRIDIYNNKIVNSGWEAIQLGSATEGAKVHDNYIDHYGAANKNAQNNGIQIGEGTGGWCYNNYIANGPGNGIIVLGLGDNIIFNNIILNPGGNGIFCDERYTTGNGFKFINNTIINPKNDGIRLYADQVALNSIINNVIVNPGSYDTYENDNTARTGEDAYIYTFDEVNVEVDANYFTRDINEVKFDAQSDYFELTSASPLLDAGADVSSFGIDFDFDNNSRPRGNGYDIGAMELP